MPLAIVERAVLTVTQAGAALRAVPRLFEIFNQPDDPRAIVPSASAVRWWLLRLGLFALRETLPVADDWLFLIDHSVQIGTLKVCVILGVRQSELPSPMRPLRLADLHLIGLHPVEVSNGEVVLEQLLHAAERVGIPREIVSDHGGDVKKGCELFAARHPQTRLAYDAAHHGANVLKKRLAAHPRWNEFNTRLGQVKAQLLQTEDACLASPSPRSKARFMNIAAVLKWARAVLRLLDQGAAGGLANQRAEARYGWLRTYRGAIQEWSRCEATVRATVSFVRTHGLRSRGEWGLLATLLNRPASERHTDLEWELFQSLRESCSGLKEQEVLLGSTEVLESLFGKWKQLERQESRSGMTSLLLSLGTLVGDWPPARMLEGLETVSTKHVRNWTEQHLPPSLQSQRRSTFSS